MSLGYPVVFVPARIETGHGAVLLLPLPRQLVHGSQQVDVALEAAGEIDPVGRVLHQINFDTHLPVQPGAAEEVGSPSDEGRLRRRPQKVLGVLRGHAGGQLSGQPQKVLGRADGKGGSAAQQQSQSDASVALFKQNF